MKFQGFPFLSNRACKYESFYILENVRQGFDDVIKRCDETFLNIENLIFAFLSIAKELGTKRIRTKNFF